MTPAKTRKHFEDCPKRCADLHSSINPAATHTPGPRKVEGEMPGDELIVIRQAKKDGSYICRMYTHSENDAFGNNNAAIIVRAVNSHDDLLEALKKEHLADEDGFFNGECPTQGHFPCETCQLIAKAEKGA